MDLTIPLENVILNIRVAVIIETSQGFVFEKSKYGYYFPVGGRMKATETSEEAAIREIIEELGITISNLKLKAIIENHFLNKDKEYQEFCFIYRTEKIDLPEIPESYELFTLDQITNIDLRPSMLKDILKSGSDELLHIISK